MVNIETRRAWGPIVAAVGGDLDALESVAFLMTHLKRLRFWRDAIDRELVKELARINLGTDLRANRANERGFERGYEQAIRDMGDQTADAKRRVRRILKNLKRGRSDEAET